MGNDMPRSVWPEWEFVKRIGRGAYGTVYEAVRTDEYGVESRAAIKVISIPQNEAELDSLRTDGMDYDTSKTYLRQIVDSFVNEVKLMIQLKGVLNIVSVEDYKVVEREEEIGWDISIRMELLTPLAIYISDKTITEQEVAKIGCDICSALKVCENKNIIHRDIKPANIFVNEFGDFKLGDFGIAKQMEGLTMDFSRKGTGAYMAPEVEKGQSYNASVDLYSLGLVLYYLLNKKRLPFNDPDKQLLTPNERERAIRRRLDGETLPAPCDASPEMTGVIRCACAYNPQQRFHSADAMENALQQLIKGKVYAGQQQNAEASASVEQAVAAQKILIQAVPMQETPRQAFLAQGEEVATEKRKNPWRRVLLIVVIVACVVVALFVVQRIRVNRYDQLVEQQELYREDGDTAREEQTYEEAVAMFPSRLESYYQHTCALHDLPVEEDLPDYVACIKFIEEEILQNTRINQSQSRMADIYYLYVDSLFQNGDYGRAEKVFEEAQNLELGDDNIYYFKGEVEKARSEYDQALEEFHNSISNSTDDDLIARAWLSCAEIYEKQGDKESAREALQKAESHDSSILPQILQELIQVDIDLVNEEEDYFEASPYRQEAIDALKQVTENGWDTTFMTYSNMIVLYQIEGDIDEAENTLLSIQDSYGSDYRWYKRAAFLEIAKQFARTDEIMDFSAFVEDYYVAREYYATYLADGGTEDPEMEELDSWYEEVQNGGLQD